MIEKVSTMKVSSAKINTRKNLECVDLESETSVVVSALVIRKELSDILITEHGL